MTKLIAIDAGWGGAVAWYVSEKNLTGLRLCPGDASGMLRLLARLQKKHGLEEWKAYLEANSSSPRFGARGNFGLGLNIGSWETALVACSIPCENVNPKTWQKITKNEKSRKKTGREPNKEKAWRLARRLYPLLSEKLGEDVPNPRNPKQGMADALCLLAWARREHGI